MAHLSLRQAIALPKLKCAAAPHAVVKPHTSQIANKPVLPAVKSPDGKAAQDDSPQMVALEVAHLSDLGISRLLLYLADPENEVKPRALALGFAALEALIKRGHWVMGTAAQAQQTVVASALQVLRALENNPDAEHLVQSGLHCLFLMLQTVHILARDDSTVVLAKQSLLGLLTAPSTSMLLDRICRAQLSHPRCCSGVLGLLAALATAKAGVEAVLSAVLSSAILRVLDVHKDFHGVAMNGLALIRRVCEARPDAILVEPGAKLLEIAILCSRVHSSIVDVSLAMVAIVAAITSQQKPANIQDRMLALASVGGVDWLCECVVHHGKIAAIVAPGLTLLATLAGDRATAAIIQAAVAPLLPEYLDFHCGPTTLTSTCDLSVLQSIALLSCKLADVPAAQQLLCEIVLPGVLRSAMHGSAWTSAHSSCVAIMHFCKAMARNYSQARPLLLDARLHELVLGLLSMTVVQASTADVVEACCRCLQALSQDSQGQVAVGAAGGLTAVLRLLQHSSVTGHELALEWLLNLLAAKQNVGLLLTCGTTGTRAPAPLTELLLDRIQAACMDADQCSARHLQLALTCLYNVAVHAEFRPAVTTRGVGLFVELARIWSRELDVLQPLVSLCRTLVFSAAYAAGMVGVAANLHTWLHLMRSYEHEPTIACGIVSLLRNAAAHPGACRASICHSDTLSTALAMCQHQSYRANLSVCKHVCSLIQRLAGPHTTAALLELGCLDFVLMCVQQHAGQVAISDTCVLAISALASGPEGAQDLIDVLLQDDARLLTAVAEVLQRALEGGRPAEIQHAVGNTLYRISWHARLRSLLPLWIAPAAVGLHQAMVIDGAPGCAMWLGLVRNCACVDDWIVNIHAALVPLLSAALQSHATDKTVMLPGVECTRNLATNTAAAAAILTDPTIVRLVTSCLKCFADDSQLVCAALGCICNLALCPRGRSTLTKTGCVVLIRASPHRVPPSATDTVTDYATRALRALGREWYELSADRDRLNTSAAMFFA